MALDLIVIAPELPRSRNESITHYFMAPRKKISTIMTPLVVIGGFFTFSETALAYAATAISGNLQTALVLFILFFPTAVATAFFAVLWKKPHHFYAPGEYGDIDPKSFASAFQRIAPDIAELAEANEGKSIDDDKMFSLIDALADPAECQAAIWMYERGGEIPAHTWYISPRSVAQLSGFDKNRLELAGIFRKGAGGTTIALSGDGNRFAAWLLKKGRKAPFFYTKAGGWGQPDAFALKSAKDLGLPIPKEYEEPPPDAKEEGAS